MSPTVQDILDIIEIVAPASLAESWDNVGLMIGNPSEEVRSILLGLDPVLDLLEEASDAGANLVVTHHPIIFHPLKSLHLEHPDGRFIKKAVREGINVISCHTNLDSTVPGTSDSLAAGLGLKELEPLTCSDGGGPLTGLGRIGNFPEPVSPDEFIGLLRNACRPPWLLAAGPRPHRVSRAAVCGGSCSDLAEKALVMGAQVFVTAEVKHSTARWAEQAGLWLIDAGHFATETPGMENLARLLAGAMRKKDIPVEIRVTGRQDSPLQLV
jgi:dinuclear metal center YbgI/SA1388 family protein